MGPYGQKSFKNKKQRSNSGSFNSKERGLSKAKQMAPKHLLTTMANPSIISLVVNQTFCSLKR
ncbi:hypothetical protein CIPAW_06G085300 [Carya illinoinensis]|uniref:Uncharacterized protein n=1 Tax=Carya illinoinensis TaxID=32201 RepID=A0A8T1Q9E9_CARIL|nr:hypothetical protein CIPAW_06G085300 [Carya illinoinensis]